MGYLYMLTFADGKSYVGATRKVPTKRFAVHRTSAKRSTAGVIYQAWRKYGDPKLTVLDEVDDGDLPVAEMAAIGQHGTLHPSGYNETPGGNTAPSLTPSVARKISLTLKGRKLSPERVEQIRRSVTGRKHTQQARLNMSAAQRGRTFSGDTRKKMALAKIGTTITDEKRAKMSAAQRARRQSEGCTPQRWRYP